MHQVELETLLQKGYNRGMQTFRKVLFWLHLICGVAVGLVVFVMSATGVVLTYEKQMERWADGFEVGEECVEGARLGPEALLAATRASTGRVPTAILVRSDPSQPVRVSFGRQSNEVHPCTAESMGEGAPQVHGFFHQMILWHRWLGQEGDGRSVGKAITGACNLAFLFIILSGSYLWWPKQWTWKQLRGIVLFRGGLKGKARDFNWHNVFGLWCAVPLFIVAGTAVFFSYSWSSDLLYAVTGEERSASSGRGRGGGAASPGQESEEPPGFAGLDALWKTAVAIEPDWRLITMRIPERPQAPVSFTLDRGNGFRPDLRTTVVLDRSTGKVVRQVEYADNPKAANARSWIRWLHTGEAGGLAGQTLAGIVSLAACFLVYTGWMLSWRRFQAWRTRNGRSA